VSPGDGDSGDRFPEGFVWGAATSAYQIEGAAAAEGKGESIWDRFVREPGRIARGEDGTAACDHYHRWREDVALMRTLGLAAYRFSVAWTRVLPSGRGRPNERGLAFYDRLVDGLLEAGIEPWLTVYHWDLPARLEDAGGWPARGTAAALAELAGLLAARLGDRVRRWITLNEPWEIGMLGYRDGVHAPGRRSLQDALEAIHVVLLGHGLTAQAIRASRPAAEIGIALDMVTCYPDRALDEDRAAARRMDGHLNRWFLDPVLRGVYPEDIWSLYGAAVPDVRPGDLETIAGPLDFVGLNYYSSAWVRAAARERPIRARVVEPHVPGRTGLGWAIHPEGLEDALLRLAEEYAVRQIAITESGAAFPDRVVHGQVDDTERIAYHDSYLRATLEAIRAGVPVSGYFAWSLLDNFEWQHGYRPRFGLVRVDRRTQRRMIKASGAWFAGVARANALPWRPALNTSGSHR
jgi:beta-glucosidase